MRRRRWHNGHTPRIGVTRALGALRVRTGSVRALANAKQPSQQLARTAVSYRSGPVSAGLGVIGGEIFSINQVKRRLAPRALTRSTTEGEACHWSPLSDRW
jgi:hypothetical protein